MWLDNGRGPNGGVNLDNPVGARMLCNGGNANRENVSGDCMTSISEYQALCAAWRRKNFPDTTATEQYMGMVEELGELSHELLKDKQGIRSASEAKAKDAVGDLMIFTLNFCSMQGWDLEEIMDETWAEVSQRNWIDYKEDGVGK